MRRRDDDTADQPERPERPEWLTWLTGVLTDNGYNMSERGGGRAKLSREAGLAPAIIARLMDGQPPSYESQLALSRATGIPLRELLIRTGRATEADFSLPGMETSQIGVSSGKPLTPEELAVAAGVPEGDHDWFVTMVRRMKRRTNESDSAAGGAAAEG